MPWRAASRFASTGMAIETEVVVRGCSGRAPPSRILPWNIPTWAGAKFSRMRKADVLGSTGAAARLPQPIYSSCQASAVALRVEVSEPQAATLLLQPARCPHPCGNTPYRGDSCRAGLKNARSLHGMRVQRNHSE